MSENTILDHEATIVERKRASAYKVALIAEAGLWIFMLVSFIWPVMSSENIPVGEMFVLPATTFIALFILMGFYLLLPILIFRSSGWKEHVGSHLCGLVISTWFLSVIFIFESWPGAEKMRLAVFLYSLIFGGLSIVLLSKNNAPNAKVFYLNVITRMGIMALLTAGTFVRFLVN